MGDFYGQLGAVSAVLAGFATTFLALLLGHQDRRRILSVCIGVTIATAASLLVAALGWALVGSYVTQITVREGPAALEGPAGAWLADAHSALSRAFALGLAGLFFMLALSGWIRSRRLGIVSIVVTILAMLGISGVLRHVIQ